MPCRRLYSQTPLVTQKVIFLQMYKAVQVYLLMYQLVWEDKQHKNFWNQFGESLLSALSVGKRELHGMVLKAGESWDRYQKKIEDFLVDWENHNSALLRVSAAKQTEGTILRKNITILKKAVKQINTCPDATQLPETKQKLEHLLDQLGEAYQR